MRATKTGAPVKLKKHGFWYNVCQSKTLLLMCLPAVIFFIAFAYAPMPGAYIAFCDFNYADGIFRSPFVGWRNFNFLFHSGQLWTLLRNTVLYNIVFIVGGNFLQMFIAILLNEVASKTYVKITQSIMFLPYFISAVLIGVLAYNMINYDYGFIPNVIRFFGGEAPMLYSNPKAFPLVIILTKFWKDTGYGTVVYFAAICGIDNSMMEAARVDGANGFQRIRYITFPCLKGTMIMLFLFSVGNIIKGDFGMFYNLVHNNALLFETTDIIETYVYRCMTASFNFSQGSAVGFFQSIFGFILVIVANGIVRKLDKDSALF